MTNNRRSVSIPYLRAYRLAKQWTLDDLHHRSDVAVATLSRVENGGTAYPATARRLARALGISVEQLLNEPPYSA